MGRDPLRKYAGVIPFCKQLGRIIVSVHPIVSMDFGGAGLFFKCITQLVRKQLGNHNQKPKRCFQTKLSGTGVQNS